MGAGQYGGWTVRDSLGCQLHGRCRNGSTFQVSERVFGGATCFEVGEQAMIGLWESIIIPGELKGGGYWAWYRAQV